MFVDARLADKQRTASSFSEAYRQYQATAETWFDGSVGSIDKRLATVNKLIHSAKSTVARMVVSDSQQYLRAAEHLGSDLHALAGLRDDLLTGASGRADVTGPPGWRHSSWATDAEAAGHQFPTSGPSPHSYPDLKSWQDASNLHSYVQHAQDTYNPFGSKQKMQASTPNFEQPQVPSMPTSIGASPKTPKVKNAGEPDGWKAPTSESKLGMNHYALHQAAMPPEAFMKDDGHGGQSLWDPNVGDWAVDDNMGVESNQPWTSEHDHEYAGYGGTYDPHNPYYPHYSPYDTPEHVPTTRDDRPSHVSDSVSPLYKPPPATPKLPEGQTAWPEPDKPPRSGHPAPDAYDKLPYKPPHKIPKMWDDRDPEPSNGNVSSSEARAPGNPTFARLASTDKRWVDLESTRFVTANSDTLDDSHELATRAHAHAALVTSTFSGQRSAAVSRAFVEQVVKLGQQAYRPAVRRQAAADPDFGDQAIFL